MEAKRLQKSIEAINTYYAFFIMLYAIALYIASNSHIFPWVFFLATPVLAGWTGYLLKSYFERRNERHGFKILSDSMTYEINEDKTFNLRYSTKLQACRNHLMVYPIGYQWSGSNYQSVPELTNPGQSLLSRVEKYDPGTDAAKIAPYKLTTTEGDWQYWFAAFNPPLQKGEVVDIKYIQKFEDKKRTAKPCLYYFVRTPIKRLELNVRFPGHISPTAVTAKYIKSSDSRRPYAGKGLQYDADKQWATWVIDNPKKGYCYRIEWQ